MENPREKHIDAPSPIVFDKVASNAINYTTFGTYATKNINDSKTTGSARPAGPLVLGNADKSAVKAVSLKSSI